MTKKQACADKSVPDLGAKWAKEIIGLYPGKNIIDIAKDMGAEVIYEKPVRSDDLVRFSEYRKRFGQIVVFFREVERAAVAHELFHHLEKVRSADLSLKQSEVEARKFADFFKDS